MAGPEALAAEDDEHPAAGTPAAGGDAPPGGDGPSLIPPDHQPPGLKVPKDDSKAGWAVVGLGHLAVDEIVPALAMCDRSRLTALVSGHPDKAKQLARAFGLSEDAVYTYETYDRLADDDRVDVVYNVLPNSMHEEFSNRAMRAGKHVFCEKPLAGSIAECDSMIATAAETGRKFGVAYRLHTEPLNREAARICRDGDFGRIKTIESSFCQNVKAPNIRLSADLDGGPVGDIGIYQINAGRYLTGEEPESVFATQFFPPGDDRFREVPESVAYTLRYPSGVVASFNCSFGAEFATRFQVHCADGIVEMDPAFAYRGVRLFTQSSAESDSPRRVEHKIDEVNQFAAEMDAFSAAVLDDGEVLTPGSLGRADVRIIEAIDQSARTGLPVRL